MKAISNILASGAAIAALVAAPAAAQYYPNQGYGYGNQSYGNNNNNVVGQILNSILGGQNYQQNDRYAIDMCVRATEARLNGYQGGYGYNQGYGNYGGYGNNGYNQGYNGSRVTRITSSGDVMPSSTSRSPSSRIERSPAASAATKICDSAARL